MLALYGDRVETRHDGAFDPATGSVTPTRSRRLGAIRLSSGPDPQPDPDAIAAADWPAITRLARAADALRPAQETIGAQRDR